VPIGSAAAETVTVRAEPARLGPGGGSTQIIALVRDEAGNGLSGTSVSFSATAGQLSSGTATTDGNGEARVTLNTNRETTVTVNVGGATDDVTIELDLAPSVTLTFTPAAPVEDQTVNFVLTVNVPAGGLPIQQARIDFGDGDSRSLGTLPNGATTVGHVYRNDGSYTVALTVTDSGGNSTTQQTVVVVAPAAPVTVSLTASDATPDVGQIVVFTATASGGTGTTIGHYEWTLGDGSTQSTTANTISHSYAVSGQKVVKVTAIASGGAEGTAQLVVTVN
jgi:PKD repeat protein